MSDGLNTIIKENASDMSCGEKQLVCLARAILKKTKILCIDEVMANIDNALVEHVV